MIGSFIKIIQHTPEVVEYVINTAIRGVAMGKEEDVKRKKEESGERKERRVKSKHRSYFTALSLVVGGRVENGVGGLSDNESFERQSGTTRDRLPFIPGFTDAPSHIIVPSFAFVIHLRIQTLNYLKIAKKLRQTQTFDVEMSRSTSPIFMPTFTVRSSVFIRHNLNPAIGFSI